MRPPLLSIEKAASRGLFPFWAALRPGEAGI
jgi:hypothetical protein